MQKLKLALVQMQSTAADAEGNAAKAMNYVSGAAGRGADLVVVPGFFNAEYFCQYRDYGHHARGARGEGPGIYFHTAFVIDRTGEAVGKYRKARLAAVTG